VLVYGLFYGKTFELSVYVAALASALGLAVVTCGDHEWTSWGLFLSVLGLSTAVFKVRDGVIRGTGEYKLIRTDDDL
jgi:hypothetical protein